MNDDGNRPWGQYKTVLDNKDCKVKIINISPGKQPSYQYHHKRSEHWVIVKGTGTVIIDGVAKTVIPGDYIFVPVESKHRIKNESATDDLVFVEVQTGSYFGEDDIVRIVDDFGRSN